MAAHALAREEALWTAAGIVPGSWVVDLGCGPGTFLADLPERADPAGRVAGVADAEEAVRTAGALVEQLGLAGRVDVVRARTEDTGLAAGSFDVAFMRNVLVHNGPSLNVVLRHAAALLRPGGHLLAAEPDVTGLLIPDTAPQEQDLEQRWITMMRKWGNDPALGRRLAAVLAQAGFHVDAVQERVDELAVEGPPPGPPAMPCSHRAWQSKRTSSAGNRPSATGWARLESSPSSSRSAAWSPPGPQPVTRPAPMDPG